MFTKVVESPRINVNMVSRACLIGDQNENNGGKGKIFLPHIERKTRNIWNIPPVISRKNDIHVEVSRTSVKLGTNQYRIISQKL